MKLGKDTPYLALTGELWGVFSEFLGVKIPRDIESEPYLCYGSVHRYMICNIPHKICTGFAFCCISLHSGNGWIEIYKRTTRDFRISIFHLFVNCKYIKHYVYCFRDWKWIQTLMVHISKSLDHLDSILHWLGLFHCIEIDTKWPLFFRLHFQIHILVWKWL